MWSKRLWAALPKVKKLSSLFNADTRCASYLVAYMDRAHEVWVEGSAEGEAGCELEKVIIIALHDKDDFEVLYKQYLIKGWPIRGQYLQKQSGKCLSS